MRKFLRPSMTGICASVVILSMAGFANAAPGSAGVSQQSYTAKHIAKPGNGASKGQVVQQFGKPGRTEKAVGEPPISIWHYDNYSVYFENNKAIHSVLHKN